MIIKNAKQHRNALFLLFFVQGIALSTWVPNDCPPEYRLNSGGKTCSGSAAEMNSGLRWSAASTIWPSSRAAGLSSGSCMLSLARED